MLVDSCADCQEVVTYWFRTCTGTGIYIIAHIMETKFTDGEEANKVIQLMTWCAYIKARHERQKVISRTGIDPMPLAFKASACQCLLSRQA